jgi:predicted O-methyltransferase YrrM
VDAVNIPRDLREVLDDAWEATKKVPGFLGEDEARFLGMVAACTPGHGSIVEIGSFKGKSTVMLAKVSKHYGLGPVVAIDPHNFNAPKIESYRKWSTSVTTYEEILENLRIAGVSELVDVRRAYSTEVSATWNSPIRFLWIDGDHSYQGVKADFDGFYRHLMPHGVVAFHDALHEYSGPIRVFAEDVLSSPKFGPSGFVSSIAWSQFRPEDGDLFQEQRSRLERAAARIIPFVKDDLELRGLRKILFKLNRSLVPRTLMQPQDWALLLNPSKPR